MKGRVFLLFILCTCECGLFAQSVPRIAVIPFKALNVAKMESEIITEYFEIAIVRTGSYVVIEQTRIGEILSAQERSISDCTDERCAIEFGRMLAAEQIVLGTVSSLGGKYVISAKIIDVTLGKNIRADKVDFDDLQNASTAAEDLAASLAGIPSIRDVSRSSDGTAEKTVVKAPVSGDSSLRMLQLLDQRAFRDPAKIPEIQSLTFELDQSEKEFYYYKYAVTWPIWPALGNTIYGLGSWLQGDIIGGLICTGSMFGGSLLASAAGENSTMKGIAGGLITGGLIAGWILPFIFESANNGRLKESLNYYP